MSDLDKLAINKNWLNSLSKYLDPYSILSSVEKVEALRRSGKNIFPPNHLLFHDVRFGLWFSMPISDEISLKILRNDLGIL